MGTKRSFFLVAGIVLLVGALFSLGNPGRVLAENAKAILVEVVNLPLDEESASLRTISLKDPLYNAITFISTDEGGPIEFEVPVGVAVTDIVLGVAHNSCTVGIGYRRVGGEDFFIRYELEGNSEAELHLNSALQSTSERPIVIKILSYFCATYVMVTGYQY